MDIQPNEAAGTSSPPHLAGPSTEPHRKGILPGRDARRVFIVVSAITIVFTAALAWGVRGIADDSAREQISRYLDGAERAVNPSAHAAVAVGAAISSTPLERATQELRAAKGGMLDVDAIYTVATRGDELSMVVDSASREQVPTAAVGTAIRAALLQGTTVVSGPYPGPHGMRVSAFRPILPALPGFVGVVGVDLLVDPFDGGRRSSFLILTSGILFALASATGAAVLTHRMRSAEQARLQGLARRIDELKTNPRQTSLGSEQASSMLATMSHELRTPLTAILGFTDLLLDPSDDITVLRSHAQTIRRNCQHLLHVLNDVLDLSRIDAGMIRVDRKPCDPTLVVSEIVDLLEPRALEKHIRLEFTRGSNVPDLVSLDVFRVRQILLNLIGNGVKFTEDGGVTVRLSYDHQRREIEFEVVDTGAGIDPVHMHSLFTPFHRDDSGSGRRFKGTGLGLAISKRLAQRLGGDIEVHSRLGFGSRFTLRIPAEVAESREVAPLVVVSEDAEGWVPRPSWRILVVEDTLEHQKLIYSCLRRSGHSVEVCDNGERAVHRVREAEYLREPYTIVVLDLYLPGIDGLVTATQMRQHGYRGPILAVTAESTPETRENCLSSGFDDLYLKPIERASLLNVLSKLVRKATSAGAA